MLKFKVVWRGLLALAIIFALVMLVEVLATGGMAAGQGDFAANIFAGGGF